MESDTPSSVTVVGKEGAAASARVATGTTEVIYGLDELSLAVLAIVVGIGLTAGFGVDGPSWVKATAGVGSFITACLLIRWRRSRAKLMGFMQWLIGK